MKLPPLNYACPQRLDEAIALLAAHDGDAKPIAGGQSLMPILAFRLASPSLLVDIGRIPGLNAIDVGENGVRLGALVRWRDIERDKRLKIAHPLLVAAISHVAHFQIRNRGTVGGSLAHADPAAEMPGIAVVCDATITLAGPGGRRTVGAEQFFTGALSTVLRADELIVEVRLPAWPAGRRWGFAEFSRRRGDFALAGVACFYDPDVEGRAGNVHVGAIGVADRPVRLGQVEAALEGRRMTGDLIRDVSAIAGDCVDPPDDIHAPGDYRRALLSVLLERTLAQAAGLASGEA